MGDDKFRVLGFSQLALVLEHMRVCVLSGYQFKVNTNKNNTNTGLARETQF